MFQTSLFEGLNLGEKWTVVIPSATDGDFFQQCMHILYSPHLVLLGLIISAAAFLHKDHKDVNNWHQDYGKEDKGNC